MKMKVSELTDDALDWAAAKCNGVPVEAEGYIWSIGRAAHQYSSDWTLAGPIIDREGIELGKLPDDGRRALLRPSPRHGAVIMDGWNEEASYLLLAMRCFVASRLGDEIDIPEELA